jgi:hypothetical protein
LTPGKPNFNIQSSMETPRNSINTLKLLQVIHRHGERNPILFPPNDPFNSEKYFSGLPGDLNKQGKDRLFRLGNYIRDEYKEYLGFDLSAHQVISQSSGSRRAIESAIAFRAGIFHQKGL